MINSTKFQVGLVGGTGFIGKGVQKLLSSQSISYIVFTRNLELAESNKNLYRYIPDICAVENWADLLRGISVVVYMSGIRNSPPSFSKEKLMELEKANIHEPVKFYEACSKSSIERFIFISSAKVNGEISKKDELFTASSPYFPGDSYSLSKAKAEIELLKRHRKSNTLLIILRPPLVYGPGSEGNLDKLIALSRLRIPLPFLGVKNKRSMVSINNLTNFIGYLIIQPQAKLIKFKKNIYYVKDPIDMSIGDIIKCIEKIQGKKIQLFWCPKLVLKFFFLIVGRYSLYQKLFESFRVSTVFELEVLSWDSLPDFDKTLKKMVLMFGEISHDHDK